MSYPTSETYCSESIDRLVLNLCGVWLFDATYFIDAVNR
jgi:hypothetical protein